MLPEGFTVPTGRTKPWGTTHAVLCAREAIDGAPFVALNADDYYGKAAFKVAYDALTGNTVANNFFMIGYEVAKTVTEHGAVTRGICKVNQDHYLTEIVECKGVEKYESGIRIPLPNGSWRDLAPETPVSMNMWGFTPHFFDLVEQRFPRFLDTAVPLNREKAEYLLPTTVAHLIDEKKITVKVLTTPDSWFGVTYAADKPKVVAALKELTEQGLYPDGLWTGGAR